MYDRRKESSAISSMRNRWTSCWLCLEKEHPEIKRGERRRRAAAGPAGTGAGSPQKAGADPARQKTVRAPGRSRPVPGEKPELSTELSQSAKRKRAYHCSKPSYRWVALATRCWG